jgi:hypothetical protein
MRKTLIALAGIATLLAATPASAEWRHNGGGDNWRHHNSYRHHNNNGALIGGAALGLATGAIVAGQRRGYDDDELDCHTVVRRIWRDGERVTIRRRECD